MNDVDAWDLARQLLPVGTRVRCTVTEHRPFGVFARIPGTSFPGVIDILNFKDEGRMTPADFPPQGSEIEAIVLGFMEGMREVKLGIRPSQLTGGAPSLAGHSRQRTVLLGVKMMEGEDPEFFGIDEINASLKKGAVVVGIEKGGPIMMKPGGVTPGIAVWRLCGFEVHVIVEGVEGGGSST